MHIHVAADAKDFDCIHDMIFCGLYFVASQIYELGLYWIWMLHGERRLLSIFFYSKKNCYFLGFWCERNTGTKVVCLFMELGDILVFLSERRKHQTMVHLVIIVYLNINMQMNDVTV